MSSRENLLINVKEEKKVNKKTSVKKSTSTAKKKKVSKKKKIPEIKEVFVSTGMTLNIGNFESVRVEAGITLKQDSKKSFSSDDLYNYAWQVVQKEVAEKVKIVRKFRNNMRKEVD